MDTYLALSYAENPMRLLDNLFLGYVGAASMILSSKLHQSQHPVTAACFGAFNTEELAFFERTMFIKLDTYISPLCTPCAFLPYILKLSSFGHNENLANLAIEIVGDFLECKQCPPCPFAYSSTPSDSRISLSISLLTPPHTLAAHYSMLFAPSTIAISAVLVSLSYLHLSADTLLSSLPKFMLNTDGYGFFLPEEGKQGYLDTKLCVDMMTRRTFRTRSLTPSPTEVWKNSDVESD